MKQKDQTWSQYDIAYFCDRCNFLVNDAGPSRDSDAELLSEVTITAAASTLGSSHSTRVV